jgi:alpha-L-rhamnosidase
MASPVRVVAELPVTRTRRPGGAVALDCGQNVAGWVRLRVRGQAGSVVRVRHAEVVEPDGALHTRALRSARAEDQYTLATDGETLLEPVMTFHGFRYAEVTTDAEVLDAVVVAISSALEPRSSFQCSLPALERFHSNVVWSQLDNFVSVPTDCPQRDERLGWTGDAQAFASTGSTLFQSQAFWASWLRDLALDQDDVLGVSTLVPDAVIDGPSRFGRAGWGDAATIVPWAVLESYGDPAVLLAQLDSMRRAIASYEGRLGPDGLLPSAMQFGDWLDPDAPAERPWEAKADSTYLANAYLVHSARLAADAAAMGGDVTWAADARALADRVARATWERWGEHARTSQTGCAVALRFGVVPEDERPELEDALARMVADADGAVRTGFLGTPLVLPALSDAGRFREAFTMLLRDEMPSWLYQVRQGATTVWERWDAILPDGSIHSGAMSTPPEMAERSQGEADNHMLSFNHYAYGAVIDWVYRHVAGVAPDPSSPGYRRVAFAPRPARGLDRARATISSAYGEIGIDWRLEGDGFRAEVSLPFGTSGTFRVPAPSGAEVTVDGSARVVSGGAVELGPGRHEIRASEAEVVGSSWEPISG